MSIADHLDRIPPNLIALRGVESQSLTYCDLLDATAKIGTRLKANKITSNDVVAIIGRNQLSLTQCILATIDSAICAPLDHHSTTAELQKLLAQLGAAALIADESIDSAELAQATQSAGIPVWRLTTGANGKASLEIARGTDVKRTIINQPYPEDTALILPSSGTTGTPKLIPLTQLNLLTSARSISNSLQLTETDRCLNVMPLYHIHGLVGATLATLCSGGSVVFGGEFDEQSFPGYLAEYQPTWYTAVPTIHRAVTRVLKSQNAGNFVHHLRFVRSCSSALHPDQFNALTKTFNVPVIEAYGMTEASHQIASNPLPPLTQKPGSVGLPCGTEVSIFDDNSNAIKAADTVGEIAIRGVSVAQQNFHANASTTDKVNSEWLRTGDLGYFDRDGYLFLTGRSKEMINRGGEKISPHEIDEVLLGHPAISKVAAFALPHETLGEDVAIAVVLTEPGIATKKDIRQFASERLSLFKVPANIYFTVEIPTTTTGKPRRLELSKFYQSQTTVPASAQIDTLNPEELSTQQVVLDLCRELLPEKSISLDDNFFSIGGDSISATRLISRLKDQLGVDVSLREVFHSETLRELARQLGNVQPVNSAAVKLSEAPPLVAREYEQAVALSYAQERLWFLDQLEGASTLYNMPFHLRLHGPLNVSALKHALTQIVDRHQILRTSISKSDDGIAFQQVSNKTFQLNRLHLSGSTNELDTALAQHLESERSSPFDLAEDLKIRATLISLDQPNSETCGQDHALLITLHHIASDGWSMGVFNDELNQLYNAYLSDDKASLPSLPVQYRDYALWQREWLEQGTLQTQLDYWRDQLCGAPALLALPLDFPRPVEQRFRGSSIHFSLSESLTQQLQHLAHQHGATLYMTLLAAFSALLNRYSGESDIVVGSPVANRKLVELEPVIGFFVNTLVLRTQVDGKENFVQLLEQVRETTLSAYQHQDIPFEKVVEELQPNRSLSYSPLFQVMFVLQNTPNQDLALSDINAAQINSDTQAGNGVARFDLTLTITEHSEGLTAQFNYNTDLFKPSTIERMIGHLTRLLESIVDTPTQALSQLSILSDTELHQQTVLWNDTAVDFGQSQTIHALFEQQVRQTPAATAVVFEDEQLTYAELNGRANQLAHYLIELGVQADTLVAIAMERSIDMVVSLLGVLKAGGAYVPIDPTYPEDRVRHMLEDSATTILLTQSHLPLTQSAKGIDDLTNGKQSMRVLSVDTMAIQLNDLPTNSPETRILTDNLAYVIYTSGSAGQPKGVMIEHRAAFNVAMSIANVLSLIHI